MRRLKKISEINKLSTTFNYFKLIHAELDEATNIVNESLYQLVITNQAGKMRRYAEQIKEMFPNSLYNGNVYRKVALDLNDIVRDIGIDWYVGSLINACKMNINFDNYQSTTKSLNFCEIFEPQIDTGIECLQVIITFKADNGIDIQKLADECEKYYKDYQKENKETISKQEKNMIKSILDKIKCIKSFSCEEEVFVNIPDNYKIYSIDGFDISNKNRELTEKEIYKLTGKNNNKAERFNNDDNDLILDEFDFDDEDLILDEFDFDNDLNLASTIFSFKAPERAINCETKNTDSDFVTTRFTLPTTIDYNCYDYFEIRNPSRLKKIKDMHNNQNYQSFEECTRPNYKVSIKTAKLKTLKDFIPNYYEYEFIEIGKKNIDVNKIVGMPSERVDEYNDDWTPKNRNDERWKYQVELIEQGKTMQPIPLVEMEDGTYCALGDGAHRISAAHVTGLDIVPAIIYKMSLMDGEENIDEQWKQYAADKINKLNEMNKEYKELNSQLPYLMFEDPEKYEEISNKVWELGDKISELDEELIKEEKEFKSKNI